MRSAPLAGDVSDARRHTRPDGHRSRRATDEGRGLRKGRETESWPNGTGASILCRMDPVADSAPPALASAGLVAGPLLAGLMLLLPAPAGLPGPAWRVAAVGVLMAVWWVTEAIPIPATSLLPLALFPALGIATIDAAAGPYASPLVFLFLGGFLLAGAMQRWGLHRRVALAVVAGTGTRPASLVGGFMLATALLSMWVSNTATAVMMLPLGLSVIELVRGQGGEDVPFASALMLGIAYAASIGGLGTPIGTPPNALLVGYLREAHGMDVSFARWMMVGVPLVAVLLPLCWLLLVRVVHPLHGKAVEGGRELLALERSRLGGVTWPEAAVAVVFTLAAALWILGPWLEDALPRGALSDAGIGIGAALLLFLLPAGKGRGAVLDWATAAKVPWDVLLLFGGGLSLADALTGTGLAKWIGSRLESLSALPLPLVVLGVVATIVVLSEVASNTAVAAAFLPLLGSLAPAVGTDVALLVVPAALAASCGFMLPVATPPNAIAYGTGHVSVRSMARAGGWLDVLCVLAILAAAFTLVPWAFGGTPPHRP